MVLVMKKYFSFFRLRFAMSLQYRMAAFAGLVTQFVWGGMLILAFAAFYRSDPNAFPMSFQATATYVWLQQSFMMLFNPWGFEGEILESIQTGAVGYELCRPLSVYNMWYARTVANRTASAFLRCWPVLIVSALLPAPYGLMAPHSVSAVLWAVFSAVLGTLVSAALCMLVYLSTFYTVNSYGVRTVAAALTDFLQGSVIPLPFLPDGIRSVVELLPFAATLNAPLRIYSGDISGAYLYRTVALQVFWLVVLVALGKVVERNAMKKTLVLGG